MNFGELMWLELQRGSNCDMKVYCNDGIVECHSSVVFNRLLAIKGHSVKVVQCVKLGKQRVRSIELQRHLYIFEGVATFKKVVEFIYRDIISVDPVDLGRFYATCVTFGLDLDGVSNKAGNNGTMILYRTKLGKINGQFELC